VVDRAKAARAHIHQPGAITSGAGSSTSQLDHSVRTLTCRCLNPEGVPNSAERKESRSRAHGVVQLLVEDPAPLVISARLVDVSAGGFRAVHHCAALSSGRRFASLTAWRAGKARVVWSINPADAVESGFLVMGT